MNTCSGKHFIVGVIETSFFVFLRHENGSVYGGYELEYNMLETLSRSLNFSFSIKEVPEYNYGARLPNKTWTGLVGLLVKREIDLAISTLSITSGRMEVISFSTPYSSDQPTFFMKGQNYNYNSGVFYTNPLGFKSWMALIFIFVQFTMFLYVVMRRQRNDFGYSFLYLLGSILKQGQLLKRMHYQYKYSLEIAVTFWLITWSFFLVIYAGGLTTSVSFTNPASIDTLQQLAKYFADGTYDLGVQSGTSYHEYVLYNDSQTEYGDLYRKVIRPFDDYKVFISIESGATAYLMSRKYFTLLMDKMDSSKVFHRVKEALFYEYIGIGFSQNFTCREHFDRIIESMIQSALLQKWEEDLLFKTTSTKRISSTKGQFNPSFISFSDMKSTSWLWFLGCGLGLVSLLVEISAKRFGRRKSLKKQTRLKNKNINLRRNLVG